MEKLLDYIIIFLCTTIFYVTFGDRYMSVITICLAITFGSLALYFDWFAMKILLFIAFLAVSYWDPSLMYFSPLVFYKLFHESFQYITIFYGIILYLNFGSLHLLKLIAIASLYLLTYILKYRTDLYLDEKEYYENLRDQLTQNNTTLNIKNKELMDKQDYEITNATLNERNRIAREIHDSVGHILSSSILQIAALTAISKDDTVTENLKNINKTLTDGMNSIRTSIHNIHEDSIDLNMKLSEIIDGFKFCEISYKYEVDDDFSIKAKYAIIYILKEALANIMKHSNATNVSVSITQVPAFYKIEIKDNGTMIANGSSNNTSGNSKSGQGMGTISIYERVSSLNGTLNIFKEHGYRIYITIPVEK